jgi:hypothetical protein
MKNVSYKTKMARYGQELMNPTIQEFLSQRDALAAMSQNGPVSGIPKAWEKVRLAPLDPKNFQHPQNYHELITTYRSDPILE